MLTHITPTPIHNGETSVGGKTEASRETPYWENGSKTRKEYQRVKLRKQKPDDYEESSSQDDYFHKSPDYKFDDFLIKDQEDTPRNIYPENIVKEDS